MKMSMLSVSIIVLAIVGVSGCFVIASGGSQVSDGTLKLVSEMRNEDVEWSGQYIGLVPKLSGATLLLKDVSEDIDSLLVDVLTDQDKFVAAHVLLTYRLEDKFQVSVGEWNRLNIQLYADGTTSFDGNDLVELQRFWKEKIR